MTFPSAEQIARAIVMACRQWDVDPVTVTQAGASRARHIAMEALCGAFPDAPKKSLARCLAYDKPESAGSALTWAKRASWWRDEWVDEIVGVLVAEMYGDQAK